MLKQDAQPKRQNISADVSKRKSAERDNYYHGSIELEFLD
jgi:hypothetical protein